MLIFAYVLFWGPSRGSGSPGGCPGSGFEGMGFGFRVQGWRDGGLGFRV